MIRIVGDSESFFVPDPDSDSFYAPDPTMFADADSYHAFTRYAANLQEMGLADRFPADAELRKVAVEILSDRYSIEVLRDRPDLIPTVIAEARDILGR